MRKIKLFKFLIICFFTSMVSVLYAELSLEQFQKALYENIDKVDEFQFLKKLAQEKNVKLYLFGGTAAAYAHYVKWDLLRLQGDQRYQEERFDYDFTNIFRSTQDLDIVVDGEPEKIAEMQELLSRQFPYFQGNKNSSWELRSLRQKYQDKYALLGSDNYDFANQHTDSNSVGLIDLTLDLKLGNNKTAGTEGVKPDFRNLVKDLREWETYPPRFLEDVRLSKLHFYFSSAHETTQYAKDGINPPLFSVIRFLTKAFQYELEIAPEDRSIVEKIIQQFDPKNLHNEKARAWLEKHAKKLFMHAVNLDYAWNTLESLGLRSKLIQLNNNIEVEQSLAWWMNKAPLPAKTLGTGVGILAKDIKELKEANFTVAHETRSFLAYESMTRSSKGEPNVFISRANGPDESAAFGDGFYTKIGKMGAAKTGITIRFQLNPEARSGTDFIWVPDYSFLIVLNKNALKAIPESLNLSVADYYEMVAEQGLDETNLGTLEKIKRRIKYKFNFANAEEKVRVRKVFVDFNKKLLDTFKDPKTDQKHLIKVASEFFHLESLFWTFPELANESFFNQLISTLMYVDEQWGEFHLSRLTNNIFGNAAKPPNKTALIFLKLIVEKGDQESLINIAVCILPKPNLQGSRDLLIPLFERLTPNSVATVGLVAGGISNLESMQETIRLVIEKGDQVALSRLVEATFTKTATRNMASLVLLLIKKADQDVLQRLIRAELAQVNPDDFDAIMKAVIEKADYKNLRFVISSNQASNYSPKILRYLAERADSDFLEDLNSSNYSRFKGAKGYDVFYQAINIPDKEARIKFINEKWGPHELLVNETPIEKPKSEAIFTQKIMEIKRKINKYFSWMTQNPSQKADEITPLLKELGNIPYAETVEIVHETLNREMKKTLPNSYILQAGIDTLGKLGDERSVTFLTQLKTDTEGLNYKWKTFVMSNIDQKIKMLGPGKKLPVLGLDLTSFLSSQELGTEFCGQKIRGEIIKLMKKYEQK